jgi:AbrB family looped-hinge helix DNA binding protein
MYIRIIGNGMGNTRIPVPVRRRGQVTIPAEVRNEMDIDEGDYVLLEVKPLPEANNE